MTVDIDKVALDAARSIVGIDGRLPLVQRKARIQCIVIDALNGVCAQCALDDERGRDLIDGGITAWIESLPTDAEIRNGIIEECIRAVAGVMRIDPQSAAGPLFDALRALSAVTSTER